MNDPAVALREYLLSNISEAEGRVYIHFLPQHENKDMPQKAIVVRMAGGPDKNGTSNYARERFDVWCDGATLYEARQLDLTVFESIMDILRLNESGILMHAASISGGSTIDREPGTDWPVSIRSIELQYSNI